jgi:hypothetical protein
MQYYHNLKDLLQFERFMTVWKIYHSLKDLSQFERIYREAENFLRIRGRENICENNIWEHKMSLFPLGF